MIKASHRAYAHFLIRNYINYILKRQFHSISIIDDVPRINSDLPLIITPNHFSWWDGFFAYYLNEKTYRRKFHILMLEDRLREYPFFAKCGAFSIDRESVRSYVETFRYIDELFEKYGGRMVLFYYPQGEMKFHREEILFKKGLGRLLELTGRRVNLLPLAVRVELLKQQYPEIFMKFGRPIECGSSDFTGVDYLAAELSAGLGEIDRTIVSGGDRNIIMTGRKTKGG
jgi:1-acyl-sn-glycerol-3-phosphate acyltransferase